MYISRYYPFDYRLFGRNSPLLGDTEYSDVPSDDTIANYKYMINQLNNNEITLESAHEQNFIIFKFDKEDNLFLKFEYLGEMKNHQLVNYVFKHKLTHAYPLLDSWLVKIYNNEDVPYDIYKKYFIIDENPNQPVNCKYVYRCITDRWMCLLLNHANYEDIIEIDFNYPTMPIFTHHSYIYKEAIIVRLIEKGDTRIITTLFNNKVVDCCSRLVLDSIIRTNKNLIKWYFNQLTIKEKKKISAVDYYSTYLCNFLYKDIFIEHVKYLHNLLLPYFVYDKFAYVNKCIEHNDYDTQVLIVERLIKYDIFMY